MKRILILILLFLAAGGSTGYACGGTGAGCGCAGNSPKMENSVVPKCPGSCMCPVAAKI